VIANVLAEAADVVGVERPRLGEHVGEHVDGAAVLKEARRDLLGEETAGGVPSRPHPVDETAFFFARLMRLHISRLTLATIPTG